jgi:hypothetical protein
LREFFNRVTSKMESKHAAPAPPPAMSWWSVGKHLIIKPFLYASFYSASAAALSLALISAPQLAAAPTAAKAGILLANSGTAFAVGSVHGSFNGVHKLLIQERALARLLPLEGLGKVFEFFNIKDMKALDMEVALSLSPTLAAVLTPCRHRKPSQRS